MKLLRKDSFVGYAILNHVGTFWSRNYFESADEAIKYKLNFEKANPACDLSKHKIVPVQVTMRQLEDR